MEIQLYQINLSRDEKEVCFMGQDYLERTQPQPRVIDSSIYDLVFQGEVDCTDLEGVYHMFNHSFPPEYTGRSMSVSDVVVRTGEDGGKTAHFCDAVGFVEVEFDVTKPKVREQELTVVLLEPGKLARVAQIKNTLHHMQRVVGGLIEPYYGFQESVCLVCNEEGKIHGLPLNRGVRDPESGELVEIIAGTCFLCDCSGSDFGSLTPEQQKKYQEMFYRPERFVRQEQEILAIPYMPEKSQPER